MTNMSAFLLQGRVCCPSSLGHCDERHKQQNLLFWLVLPSEEYLVNYMAVYHVVARFSVHFFDSKEKAIVLWECLAYWYPKREIRAVFIPSTHGTWCQLAELASQLLFNKIDFLRSPTTFALNWALAHMNFEIVTSLIDICMIHDGCELKRDVPIQPPFLFYLICMSAFSYTVHRL